MQSFRVNLDCDARKERILVYNLPAASGAPQAFFAVWDRRRGRWRRAQVQRTYGPGPGAPDSGLVNAFAGKIARDRRIQVMTHVFVTPSIGAQLAVYRQRTRRSLRFRRIQLIVGSRIAVRTRRRRAAAIKVLYLANHSPDDGGTTRSGGGSRTSGSGGA